MAQRIPQVDSFTDRRFSGNPAAVCVLSELADPRWMQDVAAEMNLSETALRSGSTASPGPPPLVHAEFRGQPLRTCHPGDGPRALGRGPHRPGAGPVLRDPQWSALRPAQDPTGSSWTSPAKPSNGALTSPAELALLESAIPAPIRFAGSNRFDLLVELEDEETLAGLRPDIRKLAQLPYRGVIATSRSASEGFDFASRFCPCVGVDRGPRLRVGALLPGPVLG